VHNKIKKIGVIIIGILRYTHLFYCIATWLFVLVFIKAKRIKELLPIAVMSMVALMITDEFVVTTGLYKFNNPLIDIMGAPLFHILWGGAAGIVFINYMKPDFTNKFVMVVLFTIITLALEFIAEQAGVATRLGNFDVIHSAFIDSGTLVVLLWISEGLYGDRIYFREGLSRVK
jgi:hypothetical protein